MHYGVEEIRRFITDENPDPAVSVHLCVCDECRRLYERVRDSLELFTPVAVSAGITLSPEQWIYCAALVGGNTFEGMPDKLSHMSNNEREKKYAEARTALTEKGLIEVAFDGKIGIKQRLYNMLDTCLNFERFLSLVRRTPGKSDRACNIYEKNGSSIVLYIDMHKGCTAVKKANKVFFSEFGNQAITGEPFTYDKFLVVCDEVKNFGIYNEGKETLKALRHAIGGSAEYFNATEIIASSEGSGRLRTKTLIKTYDSDVQIMYEPEEKIYFASATSEGDAHDCD
ncbi:MAG: hypothetical protein FWF80_03525 [Defluviitaleaceae bacterium]|nr:hypothetical protein [Defluviitaleaceae bacterium]